MAFKTGYISFLVQTGGGIDPTTGDPIAPVVTESDFVKCNLQVVTKEYRLLVDGQYQQANYSVYIQQRNLPVDLDLEAVKGVKIQDNNANDLGTFQKQNVEYLNLTQRIKLVV